MAYIKKNHLGGAMVWAADLDDFEGLYGEKWPLLSTVRKSLLGTVLFISMCACFTND
jgi:GH18 family chitinase